MKRFNSIIAGIMLGATAIGVQARETAAGDFEVIKGRPLLNGKVIELPRSGDGSQPVVEEENLWLRNAQEFAVLAYWDQLPNAEESTTAFVVVHFGRNNVTVSNPINSGQDINWIDNNYAKLDGHTLYFGVYSPRRLQFVYRDGKLSLNGGKWLGPAKPNVRTEPDESLPCANVADVPACLAEIEREEANSKTSKSGGAASSTARAASQKTAPAERR